MRPAPNGYPPPPPPPHPRVVITGPGTASLQNGQSTSLQFTAVRYDAAGAIALAARWLPQGVTATFTPASLPATSDSQQFVLTLTASATAPAGAARVQITATSVGALPGYAWINLTVASPFSFVPGAPILVVGSSGTSSQSSPTPVVLAAFGVAVIPLNLQFAAGVAGTVSFAFASALPAGVTAQFSPPNLTAPPAPGNIAIKVTLAAGASVTPGTFSLTLNVLVGSAVRATFTFPLQLLAPFVRSVSPQMGSVPSLGRPGTVVTIAGGGFGPGTTVTFGVDSPVAASSVAPDGTSLVVTVPPTAASGQLKVTSPAGIATGAPEFAVDNYRNTRGFSFENSTAFQNMVGGSYSFSDATALFGASQTKIDIFGWKVDNPLVYVFLGIADLMLDGGGQCYGMSLGSLRFATGQMGFGGLPMQGPGAEPNGPAGPDAWLLNGPAMTGGTNASPVLASFVHQQHMAQLSQESINNWVGFHANVFTASALRSAILQAFNEGGGVGAVITLNPSIGEGHAVVAYGLVDKPGGDFDIQLYNPNIEFKSGEDADSALRATKASQNVINVMHDGSWVLAHSDASFGKGPDWTGGIFNITVVPWASIPNPPSVPWAEIVLAGALVAAVIWLIAGDAEVAQVSDGQGHVLLSGGQWNTDPATRLQGVRPMPAFGGLGKSSLPAFVSNRQVPLIHTITGKASGTYDLHWLGPGCGVKLSGISTQPGESDTALIHGGGVDFTPAASKAVTATITGVAAATKHPRTATLKTTASAGAALGLSFDPATESFSYEHEGDPTNYTLELSSVDAGGKPTTLSVPPAKVGKGDIVTIKPDWNQLAGGVGTVSVHTVAGQLTNRPLR